MKTTENKSNWALITALVVGLHLALGLVPLKFSEVKSAEPPPIQISLLAPPPKPEPPPVESKPVAEPQPEPEPVAKPEPKPEPPKQVAKKPKKARPKPTPPEPVEMPETKAPEPAAPEIAEAEPAEEAPADDERPVEEALDAPQELAKVEETAPAPQKAARTAPAPKVDLNAYGGGLYRAVNAEQRYPRMARRMKMEGTATVLVRVRKDGSLAASPRIVNSSSHPLLDKEVLRMVEAAAPFAPLPAGFTHEEAQFEIPVKFSLSRT